jgi:hypothetical protein
VWQAQVARMKLRKLSLLSVGFVVSMGIFLFPLPSLAVDDSALDALQVYWRAQAPWCPFDDSNRDTGKPILKKFASKNDNGVGPNTPPCNDGDSIMFNALLCLAGVKVEPNEYKPDAVREVGCDVVKHSQTLTERSADYGRWWRSPRRNYLASLNQQPEGGSETTFSNDHALGVMAYIAQTKDVKAFQAWINWIKNEGGTCSSAKCIPGLPRYCPDDRCGFKLSDCPLLDQLANHLGTENALCASGSVKNVQALTWAAIDTVTPFLYIALPQLKRAINNFGAGEGKHSAERATILSSIALS